MSRRNDTVSLHHMLDHAREAVALVANRERADLDRDRLLQLGLTRLVEIIGEAAARVSAPTQERCPSIPWRALIGIWHRLIHGYDALNILKPREVMALLQGMGFVIERGGVLSDDGKI